MTGTEIARKYGSRVIQLLNELLSFCDEANELVASGYDRYLDDKMYRRAARSILTDAGEVVSRIDQTAPTFVADHPECELRELKDARNFVVHAYDGVDYDVLWEILESDLPKTADAVRKLLSNKG